MSRTALVGVCFALTATALLATFAPVASARPPWGFQDNWEYEHMRRWIASSGKGEIGAPLNFRGSRPVSSTHWH
jgi:hypothetical protein